MNRNVGVVALMLWLGFAPPAQAQTRQRGAAVTVTWTAIGAGAGFGIGLWAGLTVFDDAINSDRKVWTSALVGAGVGAVGGFLIGRAVRGRQSGPRPQAAPLVPGR